LEHQNLQEMIPKKMKKITFNTKIKFSPKKEASVDNPYINKVDFVLTDDQPNANMVGIKRDEFFSLASSAMFMPLKMTFGGIGDNHDGASPIGVITETVIEDGSIVGSGIVWPEERPSDIAYLKERIKEESAFISWELAYATEEFDDEGIMWLKSPICLAATLVNRPAYEDRTPMFNFSSTVESNEDVMSEDTVEIVPEVEPTPVAVEPVDPVETPVVEPNEADLEDQATLLAELDSLRQFKLLTERGKVVRDTLGDISDEDVGALVTLTDDQLNVVKKLVSAKREREQASKTELTPAPMIIPEVPHVVELKPVEILKKHFGENLNGD